LHKKNHAARSGFFDGVPLPNYSVAAGFFAQQGLAQSAPHFFSAFFAVHLSSAFFSSHFVQAAFFPAATFLAAQGAQVAQVPHANAAEPATINATIAILSVFFITKSPCCGWLTLPLATYDHVGSVTFKIVATKSVLSRIT
jgi:hypothetical protein